MKPSAGYHKKTGPQGYIEPIIEAWALRFGLTTPTERRVLKTDCCWQLCLCKDDAARRILLGVSS
jgi:hypothetical protein